jgi:hypothetical protein
MTREDFVVRWRARLSEWARIGVRRADDLLNALVYSNGDIRLVVDAQTQPVPAVWEVDEPVVRRYPSRALADVAW